MHDFFILDFQAIEKANANDTYAFLRHPDVKLMHTVFICVTLCYIPFILCGNSLVFWGTILSPALMTPNNLLLCSLSVADFTMAPWTIPMYALSYHEKTRDFIHFNKYLCLNWFASIEVSGGGSLNHLLFIAIDRYFAVMWPLKYKSVVTVDRMKKFLVLLWMYVVVMAFIPTMGWNKYDYTIKEGPRRCNFYITLPKAYVIWASFGTIGVSITIPFFLYIHITYVVCKQLQSFERDSQVMTMSQRNQFKRRVNSVKITATLMFLFILMWLPYVMIAPLKYYRYFSQVNIEIIKCITQIFNFGNAMVNAPVYAIGRSAYLDTYKLMLRTPPWRWGEALRHHYSTQFAESRSILSAARRVKLKKARFSDSVDGAGRRPSSFRPPSRGPSVDLVLPVVSVSVAKASPPASVHEIVFVLPDEGSAVDTPASSVIRSGLEPDETEGSIRTRTHSSLTEVADNGFESYWLNIEKN